MKSIRTKLVVSVFLVFLLAVCLIYVLVSAQMERNATANILSTSQITVEEMGQSIHNFLMQYEFGLEMVTENHAVVDYLATKGDPSMTPIFDKGVGDAFASFRDKLKESSAIYVSFENKQTKHVGDVPPPDNYDPTSRQWFQMAKANPQDIVWTDPYIDTFTGDHVITYLKRLFI